MTTDRRDTWSYRLRYWNARRGTAVLRASERIVAGRTGSSRASRPLAIRPPDRISGLVEAFAPRHDADVLRFPIPDGLPGWLPRDDAIPAAWAYALLEPAVAPESGAVWDRSGSPVVEVMGGDSRYSRSQDVRGLARRRARPRLPGTWAVLPSHTYYHFLLEDLPALLCSLAFAREQLGTDAHIVTPQRRHRYVSDALAGLANPVRETSSAKVAVQRLVASGFLSSHVHPSSIDLLRSHFGMAERSGHRLIYVSRVGFRRSLPQEAEVVRHLKSVIPQLEVISGHELSLADQVATFSDAAVVIGPHGAGLSNIVFSPRSARIVEIGTTTSVSDHFWRLAAIRGQDYAMAWADATDSAAVIAERVLESIATT